MKRNVRNVDQERREAANQEWVADPEEQILHALAQVRVVEGLLLAEAEINGGSPIGSEGVASAACRLMGQSLDTFERLDVVQLVVNRRGEAIREREAQRVKGRKAA